MSKNNHNSLTFDGHIFIRLLRIFPMRWLGPNLSGSKTTVFSMWIFRSGCFYSIGTYWLISTSDGHKIRYTKMKSILWIWSCSIFVKFSIWNKIASTCPHRSAINPKFHWRQSFCSIAIVGSVFQRKIPIGKISRILAMTQQTLLRRYWFELSNLMCSRKWFCGKDN